MTRDLSLLGLGFVLIALQAALGAVSGVGVSMPNALLPIAIYLGMAPDVSLARAALLSFVLGLFMDSATGNAMGLFTFVHVASAVAARAANFRLLMRSRLSQASISALTAALGALTVIALRDLFRPKEPFEAAGASQLALAVAASSLATGALAPFVFQLVRRVEALRRRDESAGVS